MSVKSFGVALASGIATFLIVGVAVTEFAQSWIEFSLFIGIPSGLVAGALAATAVYLGLADEAPERRRRIAGSFAGFGMGLLIALVVLGGILDIGITLAIGISILVAVGVAAVAYLRFPTRKTADKGDDGNTPRPHE